MTWLRYATRATQTSLMTALTEAGDELGTEAVGFLSSPTSHVAVVLRDRVPSTPTGPVALGEVFAARLFGAGRELRWVHTGGGSGVAVVLAETTIDLPGWQAGEITVTSTIEGQYALWGTRFEQAAPGWCRAVETRIGALDVPGPVPSSGPAADLWPQEHLSLRYVEYLAVDEYGNANVVEERLVEIVAQRFTAGSVSR